MLIPYLDLKAQNLPIQKELEDAALAVIRSGQFIGGEYVERFEHEYAHYTQSKYCVGVGNGLDALTLALRALNIGPGDEVIVPSHTYIATWLAVTHVGATIVPVEAKNNAFHLSSSDIEPHITNRTKIILPVHLYGTPCDMDDLCEIAKKYGLAIIEDAAQAHGCKVRQKKIGAHGTLVCWSFYPGKNLGAFGDGGAITTDNEELAEKIKTMRNYGSNTKYYNEILGFNSRLDPLHAACLSIKLKHLDFMNSIRKEISSIYFSKLINIKDLQLPVIYEWSSQTWHAFVIRTNKRDMLKKYLFNQGIETLIHYPLPPHLQLAYKNTNYFQNLFNLKFSESIADEVLSLPICPSLNSDKINFVCKQIATFFQEI